jgi:hypothetical protein
MRLNKDWANVYTPAVLLLPEVLLWGGFST